MRRLRLVIVAVALIPGLPLVTMSQTVCGDANQSGTVSVSDLFTIANYMLYEAGVVPPISASADCDNRLGITISDAETVIQYLFHDDNHFDCLIQSTYSLSLSLADTVFLPSMVAIPDGLDSVSLPIITSFAADTRAFYVPVQGSETSGPGRFQLSRIDDTEAVNWGVSRRISPDTAVLLGMEMDESQSDFTGRHTYCSMVFKRSLPGLADITCTGVVRSPTLRIAVEKNGDLFTPVVQYYQMTRPHPVVAALPTSLSITSNAGYWSKTSYDVTFTSDGLPVSFDLSVSDPWLVIDNPSSSGYTSPATITVRANASALAPGDYAGQIIVSDISPADAEFVPSAVSVTLTVIEPLVIPPGDLNCDGRVSISDIILLVDCLYIHARPVPTCD